MKNLVLSFIVVLGFFATSSFGQEKVTAQYYYPRADSIANSLLDEISFIILKSEDVDTLGRSNYWEIAYQNLYMYFVKCHLKKNLLTYLIIVDPEGNMTQK